MDTPFPTPVTLVEKPLRKGGIQGMGPAGREPSAPSPRLPVGSGGRSDSWRPAKGLVSDSSVSWICLNQQERREGKGRRRKEQGRKGKREVKMLDVQAGSTFSVQQEGGQKVQVRISRS